MGRMITDNSCYAATAIQLNPDISHICRYIRDVRSTAVLDSPRVSICCLKHGFPPVTSISDVCIVCASLQVQALRSIEKYLALDELYVLGTNCVDNGPREGLEKFLNAASDSPSTVLHYEFVQDYRGLCRPLSLRRTGPLSCPAIGDTAALYRICLAKLRRFGAGCASEALPIHPGIELEVMVATPTKPFVVRYHRVLKKYDLLL